MSTTTWLAADALRISAPHLVSAFDRRIKFMHRQHFQPSVDEPSLEPLSDNDSVPELVVVVDDEPESDQTAPKMDDKPNGSPSNEPRVEEPSPDVRDQCPICWSYDHVPINCKYVVWNNKAPTTSHTVRGRRRCRSH